VIRAARWGALVPLACAALLVTRPAEAYVRYKTKVGAAPFYWKGSCVPVLVYLNGFDVVTHSLPNQVVKSVAAAAHAWSPYEVSCDMGTGVKHPYLEIVPSLATGKPPPIGDDARNVIVFRTDNWSPSGDPKATAYAYEALAVTKVFAKLDGHIVGADIEINGVNKTWLNLDPGVTVPFDRGDLVEVHDLQNTLTHEFGHLLGLDHTCYNPNPQGDPRPQDDHGDPVPDCIGAPGIVQQTVMFDSAAPGETSKRFLSADDKRAVCEIYAPELDPHSCPLDQANCAVGAAGSGRLPPGRWSALAGVAALGWAGARRRRRGRPSA
jgi:hypothetical protein